MRTLLILSACGTLALAAERVALAQEPSAPGIHWALGAYLGSGRYLIDDTEIQVLSANVGWRPRRSERSEGQRNVVGIRIRVPMAIGAHDFYSFDRNGVSGPISISTLSVAPGVEFDVPVKERWSLSPLVHLGWAHQTNGGESALIYRTGIKSRGQFEAERFDWSFVAGLTRMGFRSDSEESGGFLALQGAIEFDQPLTNSRLFGNQVILHWHISHTAYVDELHLATANASGTAADIADEWEVGAAFSFRERRLGIRRLAVDRLGFGYRFSPNGDFHGISLVFSSLFDRF